MPFWLGLISPPAPSPSMTTTTTMTGGFGSPGGFGAPPAFGGGFGAAPMPQMDNWGQVSNSSRGKPMPGQPPFPEL